MTAETPPGQTGATSARGRVMAHFRIRYIEGGGHTHMSIFAGSASNLTHGKCGDLSMTNDEFAQFKASLRSSDFEFLDDDEAQTALEAG